MYQQRTTFCFQGEKVPRKRKKMSIVGGQLAKHRGTKEARILSDKVDEYLKGIADGIDVLQAYDALTKAPYTTSPRL